MSVSSFVQLGTPKRLRLYPLPSTLQPSSSSIFSIDVDTDVDEDEDADFDASMNCIDWVEASPPVRRTPQISPPLASSLHHVPGPNDPASRLLSRPLGASRIVCREVWAVGRDVGSSAAEVRLRAWLVEVSRLSCALILHVHCCLSGTKAANRFWSCCSECVKKGAESG